MERDVSAASPWQGALALCAAYGAAALLSLYISRQPGSLATIWYANAVAVACLAFRPWRHAPLLMAGMGLGNALANFIWGDALVEALLFLPANALEVVIGAWLVRRAGLVEKGVRSPSRLLQLLALGGVLPQLAGATSGALVLSLTGKGAFAALWPIWFEGSALGAVSMLPLAFELKRNGCTGVRPALLSWRVAAMLMTTVGIAILSLAHLPYPFVYILIPLMAAALMLELVGAALVSFGVSVTIGAMLGLGFFLPPPAVRAWEQQLFVYLACAATLIPAQLLAGALTELRESHARLEAQRRELQRANEGLEQFVRMASHDLREPLNTVNLFLSVMDRQHAPLLPPSGRRQLVLVRRAAERMRALLDDVLNFARLGHGEAQPPEPVRLEEVFEELRCALAARLQSTGAQLEIGSLPVVRGHAGPLSLLFQNLLANALKFMPPGRSPRIEVSACLHGGHACITVADNGIGIAPEDIGQLFQPFRRLHGPREYEGTGLGLTLCRQIAERHGGEIVLRSVPGEGSRFTVRLPLS